MRKQVWKAWLCGSGDYILLIFPYMGESPPSGEYVCSLLSGSWTASTSLSPKDFTGDSHWDIFTAGTTSSPVKTEPDLHAGRSAGWPGGKLKWSWIWEPFGTPKQAPFASRRHEEGTGKGAEQAGIMACQVCDHGTFILVPWDWPVCSFWRAPDIAKHLLFKTMQVSTPLPGQSSVSGTESVIKLGQACELEIATSNTQIILQKTAQKQKLAQLIHAFYLQHVVPRTVVLQCKQILK